MDREDMGQEAYVRPMDRMCALMTGENEHLRERAAAPDFDPVRELDYTENGCGRTIDGFFEAAGKYEEGRVPQGGFDELLASFRLMMAALGAREDAPHVELDAVGVAFREALLPLRYRCDAPEKPRRIYLKKLFCGRDVFKGELKLLHEAYVRRRFSDAPQAAAPARRAHKAPRAPMTREQELLRKDRRRVLDEIDRLCRLGLSAPRAIRRMRGIDTWKSRMRGKTDSTWLRYYRQRTREATLRQSTRSESAGK